MPTSPSRLCHDQPRLTCSPGALGEQVCPACQVLQARRYLFARSSYLLAGTSPKQGHTGSPRGPGDSLEARGEQVKHAHRELSASRYTPAHRELLASRYTPAHRELSASSSEALRDPHASYRRGFVKLGLSPGLKKCSPQAAVKISGFLLILISSNLADSSFSLRRRPKHSREAQDNLHGKIMATLETLGKFLDHELRITTE
ncbi:hypothetical protein PCASD_17362 [Puccinia coronata f. sp. avenae]|uniref:Uncharacterized protein n=1 Tax=Puccinia coronata f. sp. avenae TaxID=200324 RepID=A0A2N5SBN5_9BASI|nr:hypothetical protein PCASD_17362 [Puccinia coronata f. sp. avenae]